MRIIISGTVGIGKSSTSELLVKKLKEKGIKTNFLNEQTSNSIYLDFYYKQPQNWAYVAQLDFLLGRFKQWLTDEVERQNSKEEIITIYDRHFLDDFIFAELHTIKSNISEFNSIVYHAIYKELLDKMSLRDARPDYLFLLKAPLEVVLERLKKRGRDEEKDVKNIYWNELYKNYYERPMFKNHFLNNVKKVIEIDTSFKTIDDVVEEILKTIKK